MDKNGKEPNKKCVAMDITVGALQTEKESRKGTRDRQNTNRPLGGNPEFFHGINPQWKFLDEEYFEKWEKKQIEYKQRLKEICKERNRGHGGKFKEAHTSIVCMTGPEWYQELSPKQKEILDDLRTYIKKDLDSHLTKGTKSRLSSFGMRPLPNDSQIWKALRNSFGCPVEFLLVLYQLIKPHQKFYTINDRLLLSGVVHLCLRDTLKEMHIRSPSPPKVEKKPPPPSPKPKKKKYPSVYLIPFTFEWPHEKFQKYKNPIIQRPTCPYFSYICDYEPVRVRNCNDLYQEDRIDENVKVPCGVFNDHLSAEDYYNHIFKREDSSRYMLLRPKIYETAVPKTYPGILPKKPPTPFIILFDVKIYDEINAKNKSRRKTIRITCEVREKPVGRDGPPPIQNLMTKYFEKKYIDEYLKQTDSDVQETLGIVGDRPCSVCGGFEEKIGPSEMKPVREKSWIKRPRIKKKREIIYTNLSQYMNSEEFNVGPPDEKTKKIIQENKEYVNKWNKLFENIKQMEKVLLETGQCTCPDRTRDKSRLDHEMDCTCAIWNVPSPPKLIPSKISCECKPPSEDETIFVPPREDRCDCKQKARDKAMEKCEKCGKSKEKPDELDERGECQCTKRLEGCGDCVKETPMKFPLLPEETKKECECVSKTPEGGKEVTVAYVFIDNKGGFSNSNEDGTCECKNSTQIQGENAEFGSVQTKTEDEKKQMEVSACNCKNKGESKGSIVRKNRRDESKGSIERSRIFEFDRCREEAEKLLDMLKCSCSKCKDLRNKQRARYIRAGTRDGCGGTTSVIGGVYGSDKECDCLEKFEERVKVVQEYKQRMKAKVDLKSKTHQYVLGGVKQTPKGPIYSITGVIPKKPCICKTNEEILMEKQKGEKFSTSLKPGFKHAITGVRGGEKSLEYIISGATKECSCSKVYEKFTEEHNECLVNYERYLTYMRKEIDAYMEDLQERYTDPPLTDRELIKNEIRKMTGAPGMPLPDGRSRFLISGVRESKQGKNFVLGSLPLNRFDPEERTIRVESYTGIPDKEVDLPTKCQKMFLCNFVTIGKDCGNPFKQNKEIEIRDSSEEIICRCISYESLESQPVENEQEEEVKDDGCACECPCGVEIKQPEDCSCPNKESEDSCVCADLAEAEDEEEEEKVRGPEGCTCGYVSPESSGTASDPCLCDYKNCGCQADTVCVKECFYGPMEAWLTSSDMIQEHRVEREDTPKEEDSTEAIIPYGGPSRRYVILQRPPQIPKDKRLFIEKLLKGLANDGYPLARLPDVHKLPYFVLWLQFRERKKWTYEDAVENYKKCRLLWNHVTLCKRKIPKPKLPHHCVCEAKNYTYRDAEKAAEIIKETRRKFYDKIRRGMVDYAREFYSTLFPYRYPNPAYFNHYFYAYQPGKLEDVIAEYMSEI